MLRIRAFHLALVLAFTTLVAAIHAQDNTAASGTLCVKGTAQAGLKLRADTSQISDDDSNTKAAASDAGYASYQWVRVEAGIDRTPICSPTTRPSRFKVNFTDDADNAR